MTNAVQANRGMSSGSSLVRALSDAVCVFASFDEPVRSDLAEFSRD
jgi:hypothetical protein